MSELSQQIDNLLTREGLKSNKYLLKHIDQNLQLPIHILVKENSISKHSPEQIMNAIKSCKNCRINEPYVQVLIKPHTNNIVINEISTTQSDFKQFLHEHFLQGIEGTITFDGGCCKVTFKDDETGLDFLDRACNHPQHPLKAYVEPENVYNSLNPDQHPYYYDNQMFQNLYIRKASDDHQHKSEPFYPTNQRKTSEKELKPNSRKVSNQEPEKKAKNTPKQNPYVEKVVYVEKQKVQQSPYVEKKQEIQQQSPQKSAAPIQYKKEVLINYFKQIQSNLKVNQNLLNMAEEEKAIILGRTFDVSLEHIRPTPVRKESFGTPQHYVKGMPSRKVSEQQFYRK
ncbi:hypothetical protein pb186bvf_009652 [Paramecium bursaria]